MLYASPDKSFAEHAINEVNNCSSKANLGIEVQQKETIRQQHRLLLKNLPE